MKLLNFLRRAHVPATFFVVGREVERSPALVRLEVADGHEIGNHTHDHVSLTGIPPALVPYELNACTAAIEKITGAPVRFFCPPGGGYDGATLREAAAHGYTPTLWTDAPGDFTKPGAGVILKRSLERLKPGAIILMHDGLPHSSECLAPTRLLEKVCITRFVFIGVTPYGNAADAGRFGSPFCGQACPSAPDALWSRAGQWDAAAAAD